MYQRTLSYARAAHVIMRAGGTLASGLLYPFRRRSADDPRCQIWFKNNICITAPSDFPLVNVLNEIWIEECYRSRDIDFQSGATVVDIGSNVGVFSVLLAASNPQLRVIAVEPSRSNLQFLYRNVASNQISNVVVVPAACGGTNGEAMLYGRTVASMDDHSAAHSHGALCSLFSRDVFGSAFTQLHMTALLTLDELFERHQVMSCDLLKLDCEGAEYDILFNVSKDVLGRIKHIAMEYHVGFNEHSVESLEHFLETNGFRVNRLPMGFDDTGYLYASNNEHRNSVRFVTAREGQENRQ